MPKVILSVEYQLEYWGTTYTKVLGCFDSHDTGEVKDAWVNHFKGKYSTSMFPDAKVSKFNIIDIDSEGYASDFPGDMT